MNRNTLVKIIIIILIIAGVVAVYLVKNSSDNSSDNKSSDQSELYVSSVNIEEITSAGLPVILDFGSDSCVPCKEMAPVLEKYYEETKDKAIIQFIDVWEYTDAADKFPVNVIPTQVFYNSDGAPYIPSDELKQSINLNIVEDESGNHQFTTHEGGLTDEQMNAILNDMGVNL